MNDQTNPFEDYGMPSDTSVVQQAIEDLAVQCVIIGLPIPKKIVFPKGALARVSADLKKQIAIKGEEKISGPISISRATSGGRIELVEEE